MKEIIAENRSFVRAVIRKITGSYNDDIEQEVYIKTWKNLPNYEEKGKFRHWIGIVTANICRDYFKSKQYRQQSLEVVEDEAAEISAQTFSPEELADAKFRQKMILKAVNELPSQMKKVIILFEFEGLSQEQIAKKIGIPVGTVKSRLFHAKKILSQKLKCLL